MKKSLTGLLILCALMAGVSVNLWFKADFVTLEGESKQWRELHGQWVVVNYFAQWCAPCLREIPELNGFYRDNPQVAIFAVSFDPLDQQQLLEMREQHNIVFPVIAKISTLPWHHLPKTLPHTLILDPQGRVARELKGEQTAEGLRRIINELSAELQGS